MKATLRLNTSIFPVLSQVLGISKTDLIARTSISSSTYYRIVRSPDSITVQQLLSLANGLHIPLSRFFSEYRDDIVERREYYVAEPYLPCKYDGSGFQKIVMNSSEATWTKAAKATGMTRSRLRDSILAVSRTPVVRFIAVCNVFEANPFQMLIDPNPRPNKKKGSAKNQALSSPDDEITALARKISDLAAAVAELSAKYDELLRSHEALSRRVSVNINTINGSHLSIATDPDPSSFGNKK